MAAGDVMQPQEPYYMATGAHLRQVASALSDAAQALDAAARALLRATAVAPITDPAATAHLRGAELQQVIVQVARGRAVPGEEIHYRDLFSLVERGGYRVGGRDPLATFLTALSRCPEIAAVGKRSGLYRLRMEGD